ITRKRAIPGGRDAGGKPAASVFGIWLSDWGTHNALILLAILFAYPFLLEPIGFAIMGFLAVFVITWRLRAGLAKSAAFALISVTATMFFFKYAFFIDLPPGLWSPTASFGFFSLFR
ncbi:MAG: hypothetical protein LBE84_00655, partial [Planctomycetota bacterium]|nr:hypothetical protein [Planctomycetota bacterium]